MDGANILRSTTYFRQDVLNEMYKKAPETTISRRFGQNYDTHFFQGGQIYIPSPPINKDRSLSNKLQIKTKPEITK